MGARLLESEGRERPSLREWEGGASVRPQNRRQGEKRGHREKKGAQRRQQARLTATYTGNAVITGRLLPPSLKKERKLAC